MINLGGVHVAQPSGQYARPDSLARLAEVVEAMRASLARYSAEVDTGRYADGRPLAPQMLQRRRLSVAALQLDIATVQGWMLQPPRNAAALSITDRDIVERYELASALFGRSRL